MQSWSHVGLATDLPANTDVFPERGWRGEASRARLFVIRPQCFWLSTLDCGFLIGNNCRTQSRVLDQYAHIQTFRGKLQTQVAIGRSTLRNSQKLVCSCLLHKIIISCTKVSVPRLHANNTGVSENFWQRNDPLFQLYKISVLLLLWRRGYNRNVTVFYD